MFAHERFGILFVATMAFSMIGAMFGFAGLAPPAFIFVSLASIGLLVIAGRQGSGLSSFSFIFSLFFIAYGLIASVGALVGMVVFLQPPYLTDFFLAHFGLACGGLILGLLVFEAPRLSTASTAQISSFHSRALIFTAIMIAALATLFEAGNALRAGGLDILLSGKADYQSAVTSLRGTLPSEFAARIAVAMMALWMSCSSRKSRKPSIKNVLAFIVLLSPVLILYLYLGRRTEILALLLIGFVAVTWGRPLRRLTLRLIMVVGVVYLAFAIILILRETVFYHNAGGMTAQRITAVGMHVLIPSSGEFGAPFAVFSEYLKRTGDAALLWGASYLDGFALVIPSFLYPGQKPVQLDAAFFAAMHPDPQARPGGIAGYGYSPLLEALVNFGSLGVAVVYFIIGVSLALIERLRTRFGALPVALSYLMVIPIGQMFHRSTFGNAVLSPGLWIVITVLFASMIYSLMARRRAPSA